MYIKDIANEHIKALAYKRAKDGGFTMGEIESEEDDDDFPISVVDISWDEDETKDENGDSCYFWGDIDDGNGKFTEEQIAYAKNIIENGDTPEIFN